MHRSRLIAAFISCIAALAGADRASALVRSSGTSLSISLDDKTGQYEISSLAPPWTFGGKLDQPPHDVSLQAGHDSLGDFQEIVFHFNQNAAPLTGRIRAYAAQPAVLFSLTYDQAAAKPVAAFPKLTSLPPHTHNFSYAHVTFAPPVFDAANGSTPWLLFDSQNHAAIISPASHFLIARLTGDGQNLVSSELNPQLENLPAGFTQQTLLVIDTGINRAWDRWGNLLTRLSRKVRPPPDADPGLKSLGYWTDNGCYYYYNYDHNKGYTGTLLALAHHFRDTQIPVRYLQLDSWWYYKSLTDPAGKEGKPKNPKLPQGEWNRYGGLLKYQAHKDLFPDGLLAFQKKLGLPLIAHNRWVDPNSPYHDRFKISGVAAIDPKFWDEIISYLKSNGVFTYEQDWLSIIEEYSPDFATTPDTGDQFFDAMSNACRASGLSMQYCMPLPDELLEGSRYGNLTTSRVSGDRFGRGRWRNFLYTSRLAWALGIYPWTDPYYSTETDNLLLSVLSAGMVGFGDRMGNESKENLLRAVRADGMIVKPDLPIVPTDAAYLTADDGGDTLPLIASTHTDHNGLLTAYVFAFAAPDRATADVKFSPRDLSMTGPVYVYDYFARQGWRVESSSEFTGKLDTSGCAFYQLAPIGRSGLAFLGDAGKFVSTGKQRIASIADEPHRLTAKVLFAAGEDHVLLHGFTASAAPSVAVEGGAAGPVSFDSTSGLISVDISPVPGAPPDNSVPDPVRTVTVVFTTR